MTRFLLLTTNRSGVLSRIISMVSSTGANIESAVAYPLGDSGISVVHLISESLRPYFGIAWFVSSAG